MAVVGDLTGKINLMFSDSVGIGYNVPAGDGYFELFNARHNSTGDNRGVSGSTLSNTINTYCPTPNFEISSVPNKGANHQYLFMAFGGNDALLSAPLMTPADFKLKLEQAIDAIVAKGWSPADIVIVNGYYIPDKNLGIYVGYCGVTTARPRVDVTKYSQYSNEVAFNKGCIIVDMYTYLKHHPIVQSNDDFHPDSGTHLRMAQYIDTVDFRPYNVVHKKLQIPYGLFTVSIRQAPEPIEVETLLTGAERFVPPYVLTTATPNVYIKEGTGVMANNMGKMIVGDGWIAEQFKADAGFSHYLFRPDGGAFIGYYIDYDGAIITDTSVDGEGTLLKPKINEFVIFGRFGGNIQLRYGTTIENSVVKKDFGANSDFIIVSINSIDDPVRTYMYHPQGVNLTNQ